MRLLVSLQPVSEPLHQSKPVSIIQLITEKKREISVSPDRRFETFQGALAYTKQTIKAIHAAGHSIRGAAAWIDRFQTHRQRTLEPMVLGIAWSTVCECRRVAPGGQWIVQVTHDGIAYQFQAWYSRFLPYAQAMMLAEGVEMKSPQHNSQRLAVRTPLMRTRGESAN